MNLAALFPKRLDAVVGRRLGRSEYPRIVTPLAVTVASPSTVEATLPPLIDAMSTMTAPRFTLESMASSMSLGAGRPGMRAVVTMMSALATASSSMAASAALYPSDISLAYLTEAGLVS